MVLYNGLRSAMPLSERSGERKATERIAQGTRPGFLYEKNSRPARAKALIISAFALAGRSSLTSITQGATLG